MNNTHDRLPIPRENTLVTFRPEYREWIDKQDRASFSANVLEAIESETFYFLSEISNVEGRCLVAAVGTGKVFGGFHTESFIEVTF